MTGALLKKVLLIVAASLQMPDEPVFHDLEVPSYGMLCHGRADATSTNQEVKRGAKVEKYIVVLSIRIPNRILFVAVCFLQKSPE